MIKKFLALVVCFFIIGCVGLSVKKPVFEPDAKIHQTYLINGSSHFAEYLIENTDYGVMMYSGVLPPRWAVENEMKNWEERDNSWNNTPPWILKVEIHEELLGNYKIHLLFLYTKEGAHDDGRWRNIVTSLSKEDFNRKDNLVPYWEINDDPVQKTNHLIQTIGHDCSGDCKGNCDGDCKGDCEKKGFEIPLDKVDDFLRFLHMTEIKIMSAEYSEYMDLVYWLLYNGHKDAGEYLRKHIGEMKLLP
jgi:hypothetical protein